MAIPEFERRRRPADLAARLAQHVGDAPAPAVPAAPVAADPPPDGGLDAATAADMRRAIRGGVAAAAMLPQVDLVELEHAIAERAGEAMTSVREIAAAALQAGEQGAAPPPAPAAASALAPPADIGSLVAETVALASARAAEHVRAMVAGVVAKAHEIEQQGLEFASQLEDIGRAHGDRSGGFVAEMEALPAQFTAVLDRLAAFHTAGKP